MAEGRDGLHEHLKESRALSARFAKWRAVIRITDALPSSPCVSVNTHVLCSRTRWRFCSAGMS
jgi:fructose-bisphosphate aldolase class I